MKPPRIFATSVMSMLFTAGIMNSAYATLPDPSVHPTTCSVVTSDKGEDDIPVVALSEFMNTKDAVKVKCGEGDKEVLWVSSSTTFDQLQTEEVWDRYHRAGTQMGKQNTVERKKFTIPIDGFGPVGIKLDASGEASLQAKMSDTSMGVVGNDTNSFSYYIDGKPSKSECNYLGKYSLVALNGSGLISSDKVSFEVVDKNNACVIPKLSIQQGEVDQVTKTATFLIENIGPIDITDIKLKPSNGVLPRCSGQTTSLPPRGYLKCTADFSVGDDSMTEFKVLAEGKTTDAAYPLVSTDETVKVASANTPSPEPVVVEDDSSPSHVWWYVLAGLTGVVGLVVGFIVGRVSKRSH